MRLWLPPLAAIALCAAATGAETAELPAIDAPFVALAAAEIASARIGWRHDDLRAVLQAAAADGLPLVVATEGDGGAWFANVLRCPTLNSLSGQAHFILIKLPVADASEAGRLVNALHMDPAFSSTLAVLRPGGYPFTEVLRVRGYLDEASLLAKLADAGLSPRSALPLERAAVGDEPPRDCVK